MKTRRFTAALLPLSAVAVLACQEPQTINEAVEQLEASGQLPKLDRSETLLGSDGNGNRVRDDIDAYIAALPDTTPQKQSLRQMSAAFGGTLVVDTNNDAALREASSKLNNGINCIWQRYDGTTAEKKVNEMQKLTINTRKRFDAHMKYNTARNGSVTMLPKGDTCENL